MPTYLLVDNGSKKAEATLKLRELAKQLSITSAKKVYPVSLQHADDIDTSQLNNVPADTIYHFLYQQLEQGNREFIVIPLFFGLSRALTSFIPEQVKLLEEKFGAFSLKLADVIFPLPGGDGRLAKIVAENINATVSGDIENKHIVLVDHGSPAPKITEVRNRVAEMLSTLLNDIHIDEAVMERREGAQYDFNGDLLENYLREQAETGHNNIIVAMLFFLPGRHAGECGDVQEICDNVIKDYPDLNVYITPLISENDLLISILHDRLLAAEK